MSKPGVIVAVSGVTRCGSSMMMNMLSKGGMPTVCDNTISYEDGRAAGLPDYHRWLKDAEGHAVKLLDVHRFTPPTGNSYAFIYMSRDKEQQAKSFEKFLTAGGVLESKLSRQAHRRLVRSIGKDTAKGLRICAGLGDVLRLDFEEVLGAPGVACAHVFGFILERTGVALSIDAMIESIIDRPSDCLDYMLEEKAIRAGSWDGIEIVRPQKEES